VRVCEELKGVLKNGQHRVTKPCPLDGTALSWKKRWNTLRGERRHGDLRGARVKLVGGERLYFGADGREVIGGGSKDVSVSSMRGTG